MEIIGRVIDGRTEAGIPRLQVDAKARTTKLGPLLLGQKDTNEQGVFTIEFGSLSGSWLDRPPSDPIIIDFTVLRDGQPLTVKDGGSVAFQKLLPSVIKTTIKLEIPTDDKPPAPPAPPLEDQTFVVRVQVRAPNGTPLADVMVQAFDQDLRSKEPLGVRTVTDRAGRCEIGYSLAQFRTAEETEGDEAQTARADLSFGVFTLEGSPIEIQKVFRIVNKEQVPVESPSKRPTIFNAKDVEEVMLIAGEGEIREPSEYEQIFAKVTQVSQGLPLADLTEDKEYQDITFIAGETGIDPQHIKFLVLAAKLSRETALPSDTISIAALPVSKITVPPEVFYGLFRQNLPTSLPALLSQSPQVLRRALETSSRNNIIRALIDEEVKQVLAAFRQLIVEQAFNAPKESGRYSLSALLSTAMPSQDLQRKLLTHYVHHEGPIEDFWQTVPGATGMSEADVTAVQFTLQLGMLTGNHVLLVKNLQQDMKSLRDLAKLDADAWLERVKRVGFPPDIEGKDDEEKSKNYANILTRIVEDAFPTAVIARHIEKDDIPDKEDLVTFFAKNPEFEFRSYQVDTYLKSEKANLEGADREKLRNQLKSRERLFKLTPRYEEMKPLLADGLDSAHRITNMGQSSFVMNYSDKVGGTAIAEEIYAKANQASVMALTLLTTYGAAFNATEPRVTEIHTALKAAFEHNPSWEELFGSTSYCDCEHCRSVLSPAAYLADILHFLRGHHLQDKNDNTGSAALKILWERRPDIGNIELTCENTNTLLPYVDLTNEVLENAIALFMPFSIDPTLESDLDNQNLSQGLEDAFKNNHTTLSSNAVISVTTKGSQWLINDNGREYKVVKASGAPTLDVSLSIQTRGTAEELSANPEHINPAAYDKLLNAVYPWNMPLNLWVEEARTYIEHLGVGRHDMMKTFYKGTPSDALTDLTIAHEYLGLTSEEAQIITGAAVEQTWEYWGLKETNNDLIDPVDGSTHVIGNWDEVLKHISIFLQQTGSLQLTNLAYKELLELLDTHFINPVRGDGAPTLAINDLAICDLSRLEIAGLDAAILSKIHRFIRLQRKLGWTIRDLDKTITALQPKNSSGSLDLTEGFLIQLSHIERLRAELKVPLFQVLSWWAVIDTAEYTDYITEGQLEVKPLYEQLFLNKTVMHPVDEIFKLKEPKRDELEDTTGKLRESEHIPTLLAALGISETDLALLTKKEVVKATLNLAESEVKDDTLNLDNLSHLYRIVSLAKALKLSIKDFLLVKALIEINPFDPTHTENTLRFSEKVNKIRESGFSVSELDYLLRHHFVVASSGTAPTEKSIALVLDEIRSGLQKIAAENTFTVDITDPTGELTRKKLAGVLSSDQIDAAVLLIDGTSPKTTAKKEAYIDQYFGVFLDPIDAKTKLISATAPTAKDKEERFRYVLERLMKYLRKSLSESFVKQKLGEALKLETAAVELLLFKLVKSQNDPTMMSIFLEQPFIESQAVLTEVDFKPQFQTFILLHKIAILIAGFKMRSEELGWIIEQGASQGWLDFNTLPTDPSQPPASFNAWERLMDLFRLLDKLPSLRDRLSSEEWQKSLTPFGIDPKKTLLSESVATFDLAAKFNGTTGHAVDAEALLLQILSERTQWNLDDLKFLAGAKGFGFTFPDDYKDERALVRLKACFTMMKRLGVSAEECSAWVKTDLIDEDANHIKQVVKAKYDNDQWLAIAKPLRDPLREKQRSALVSYLVARPTNEMLSYKEIWRNSNDLFDYFLIDAEMSPCMMTSRIKQAIGSVQLFIQRCLMNLEKQVIPTDGTDPGEGGEAKEWREHWKWMKNYRVWEANRKVFLWPENWIEPELRDDKTPFFKDMENQLLQNEVTMETAEAAFLSYLEKLDAVAHLEIVGMYHQEAEDKQDKDVLHVFGRTMGIPHIYYYRQGVKIKKDAAHNYWTWAAWEKVDLDIEGDHLIPVVWNRRLHLFWPTFTEKAHKDQTVKKTLSSGLEHKNYYPPADSVYSKSRSDVRWDGKSWVWVKENEEKVPDITDPVPYKNGPMADWEYRGYGRTWVEPGEEKLAAPAKYWDIKIAWSEYKNKKWSAKKVTKKSLDSDLEDDKSAYTFKGLINWGNLVIRCFRTRLIGDLFHSEIGEFTFTGCQGDVLIQQFSESEVWVVAPEGSRSNSQMFCEYGSDDTLYLPTGEIPAGADFNTVNQAKTDVPTLLQSPGSFHLLYPHQDEQFLSQRPFFYQDDTKTFFVIPND